MKNHLLSKRKRLLIAALILAVAVLSCGASLITDYLELYRSSLSPEAIAVASVAQPPNVLSPAERQAYLLGFAAGFDAATGYSPMPGQLQADQQSARLVLGASLLGAQPAAIATVQPGPVEHTYILNTSSKKFHYPDCASAMSISAKNKLVFVGLREELIRDGYQPCKNCDP